MVCKSEVGAAVRQTVSCDAGGFVPADHMCRVVDEARNALKALACAAILCPSQFFSPFGLGVDC